MASLQKIALYIFFDSMEQDLVNRIRELTSEQNSQVLTDKELAKARDNLSRKGSPFNYEDEIELLTGLDLGEKFDVLMRQKKIMHESDRSHFTGIKKLFENCVSVRNTVMHGRPLTIDEYTRAFALTTELMKHPKKWPVLSKNYTKYSKDPGALAENAVQFLETFSFNEAYNNLPVPDYDDTGFFPRPRLEKELKNKILGRHPVVTVLGDGGDGKTAVTLQTLYSLLSSNDHDFDAIIWVSAKSSKLTVPEIKRIETAITSSLSAFGEVVELFQEQELDPIDQVLKLMEENKILLVIDNLETIIDKTIQRFAQDIPGESKLLLTSRIPLGSDLPVKVEPFSDKDALAFLRVLINVYDVGALRKESDQTLTRFSGRLHNKPLLLKWFVLGVRSGLNPSSIVSNPENALKFCLENVFEALSVSTKKHLAAMATLPRAVSLAVLKHVTNDEVHDLEASLAELMRFAIVEQKTDNNYETSFEIKPLAKAYLVRVLKAKPKDAEEILQRFRQIEGIFQQERGTESHNRYNPNQYIVRSKTEALAVKGLKQAVIFARRDEFLEAFKIIDELKVSCPDYFEVSRIEGYISSLAGDNSRAQQSYETAIELAENQPQTRILLGNFLLRVYNDYEAALFQYDEALRIDPEATPALFESARACMFLHDFERAEGFLNRVKMNNESASRQEQILKDLEIQLTYRRLAALLDQNDAVAAKKQTTTLIVQLDEIGEEHLDQTLRKRIQKYQRIVNPLRDLLGLQWNEPIQQLEKQFKEILAISAEQLVPPLEHTAVHTDERRIGHLKEAGRKPGFGFIVDQFGEETFVPRATVDAKVWEALLDGASVGFDVALKNDGRTVAINLHLGEHCK